MDGFRVKMTRVATNSTDGEHMLRGTRVVDKSILNAALQGLELQRQRIEEHITQVRAMLGIRPRGRPRKSALPTFNPQPASRRGTMSAAGRRRIALAQKKRWAKYKKAKAGEPRKHTMSVAGRKRIAAATRKRWAAFRAKKAAEGKGIEM